MKLEEFLTQYPRIKVGDPANQDSLFEVIDQTSMTSQVLQISFERKPDFYSFLRAQGERAFVYHFVNQDGSTKGFAASTFRNMSWQGKLVCLGYTSDLRTTTQLDREARLQWRRFYGSAVENSNQIQEFNDCIGFVTAVWNDNTLAQKSLVKKKRPGDFTYEVTGTYSSQSIWGRWRPHLKPKCVVRRIKESEVPGLRKLLCARNELCWNEADLLKTLQVFGKTLADFQVLEKADLPSAFVLPVSTSVIKKTVIKKWPKSLELMAKLLPFFGKPKIQLNQPIEILQLMLFRSVSGDETLNLTNFIDHFWYQNNQSPKSEQFSILTINRWNKPQQKPLHLKQKGYLLAEIQGSLYKVLPETGSPLLSQISDFSNLEIGFL